MAQGWTGLKSNRTIADITKAVGNRSVEIEENRPTERQKRYYKTLLEECIKYKIQPIRPSDLYKEGRMTYRKAYAEAIAEMIKLLDTDGRWDGYERQTKNQYTHDSAKDRNKARSKKAFARVPKY